MSANATGYISNLRTGVFNKNDIPPTPTGNISATPISLYGGDEHGSGRWAAYYDNIHLNVAHTHNFNHSHTTDLQGEHAHTIGETGSGTAVDMMPPYKVMYCWHRTA